jgi:hypothetical protein
MPAHKGAIHTLFLLEDLRPEEHAFSIRDNINIERICPLTSCALFKLDAHLPVEWVYISIPRTSKLSTPIRNALHYLTDIPRWLRCQFDNARFVREIGAAPLVHFAPAAIFVLRARLV